MHAKDVEDARMHAAANRYSFQDKAGDYAQLAGELAGLLAGEEDPIARTANTAALIFGALPDINWAGFYFLRNDVLVVGPFQGKPACTRIAVGKGVCGTAVARREIVVVPDVAAFPGHIACDSASRSEIVIPLLAGEKILGVLDIDSPSIGRFDSVDARGLEQLVAVLLSDFESY
jgi:GAF domain-containing protein